MSTEEMTGAEGANDVDVQQAAQASLAAAERCPADPRALGLLVDLLDGHPEIVANDPDLQQRIASIHRAVVNFLN